MCLYSFYVSVSAETQTKVMTTPKSAHFYIENPHLTFTSPTQRAKASDSSAFEAAGFGAAVACARPNGQAHASQLNS